MDSGPLWISPFRAGHFLPAGGLVDDREAIELTRTAHHEAGHVVACRCFGRPIVMASIDKSRRFNGHLYTVNIELGTARAHREQLIVYSAGRAASLLFDPSADPGDEDDRRKMTDLAWQLVGKVAAVETMRGEMRKADRRADSLIRRHRADVHQVAGMLLSYHEEVSSVVPFDLELERLDPGRGRANPSRAEGSFPGGGRT